MRFRIFNPTGGLFYHLRGRFYSDSLWRNYRLRIEQWLMSWKKKSNTLVIIGPSAGYSLSDLFLSRYDEVHLFEIDPLAEYFFNKKHLHKKTNFTWHKKDILHAWRDSDFSRETFLKEHGIPADADLLYSNFLGQLKHLLHWNKTKDAEYEALLSSIAKFNEGANWASYHDRISSMLHPLSDKSRKLEARMKSEDFIAAYFSPAMKGELWEHDLDILFNEKRFFEYHLWPVTKKQFHIIECWKSGEN